MRKGLSVGIGAAILVVGCGTEKPLPTGGRPIPITDNGVHISVLADSANYWPLIDAPDSAKVDSAVTASFWTVVSGCDGEDTLAVETDSASVTVTPYNRYTFDQICPGYISWHLRTAAVVFTKAGLDTISVHAYVGAYFVAPGHLPQRLETIQRTILVKP